MFLSKSRLAIAPAATRSFSSPLSSHLVYRASTTTPHSSMSSSSSPPPQDDENRNAHARNAIQISPGQENETQLIADATALLNQEGRRRWKLVQEGKGVQREFLFKTFKGTWDFMTAIAQECKTQKHHPEWTNVYNRTTITWTTHQPEGLSTKDVYMAGFCDRVGKEMGEVVSSEEKVPSCKTGGK